MRLWPRTLFGRLVIILVSGMLAAQILTSSIWFDVRRAQVLEIPTRLIASRLADVVLQAHRDPAGVDDVVRWMNSPRMHLTLSDTASSAEGELGEVDKPTEQLLGKVLSEHTGYVETLRLLKLDLIDADHQPIGLAKLLRAQPASGRFVIEIRLPDNRWLQVQAIEEQGWNSRAPLDVLFDYLIRIYLLRIVVLVIIALIAVRLAIQPLNQLAQAAQRLGKDIHQPPLLLSGPVEVTRAATAFNAMQQRLISNLAERTRFLAAISHDLRSPITRLRLRTEKILDPALKGELCHDLDDMEQTVSSTLEFVSGEQITEQRQRLDINSMLLSLQGDFADLGEQIQIQGRARLPIQGFAQSLKRCLLNLLENAVRYGGDVTVTIQDGEEAVRIIIRDHGPGIPEHLLTQVLEPFFRVEESRNACSGGYGLGLSIADMVARAHGGNLALSNEPEGGLTATLTLPR